jgi:membrane protein required for colicin V production
VTLDLVVLGLVLLAAAAGAVGGGLRQVLKLAALVAGWAAARWLAPRLVRELEPRGSAAGALIVAGTFVAGWLVASLLALAIRRAVQGEEEAPGRLDRLVGAVLGAAKGALVAWVLLSLLTLLGGRLVLGPLRVESRGSRAAALVARHDLFSLADARTARAARRLVEAWRDPVKRERLLRDPAWSRLLETSGLRSALDRGAGGAEDAAGAARRKVEGLMDDPELRSLLERLGADP